MKNEQFSTPEKSENSKKTQFCSKSSVLDPIRTEEVKVGQVRSPRGSTRPLKLTCQSDTPIFSIVKGKTMKNHPPLKCWRNFFAQD